MDLSSLYMSGATEIGNSLMSIITLILMLIVIFLVIYVIFKLFEKSKPKIEYIVILALLTAIATVGRLIGMAVPGLQFATFIIIMSGVVFDKETGLLVGMLTAIVSDFVMGLGFWTIYQVFAWGIIGYLSGMFNKKMDNIVFRTIYGILVSFAFGWFTNIIMFYYLAEINLTTIVAVYVASIPVDLIHAICTAACLILVYDWFKKTFKRSKERFLD